MERFRWQKWLLAAWIAGSLGYFLTAILKAWRVEAGLRRARTEPDMELECEFLDMAKSMGIQHRPKLRLIKGIGQPFVWGVFRGSIYLPEGFGRQGSSRERSLVMGHELAHVRRWDALINLIQVVVQAMFFFHPLVWWLNKIIRHEREKCCDEMAVASLQVDSREYGSAIVDRLAAYYEPACPASALAISGHAKDLEDRIKSLLQPGRAFRQRPTVAAVLIALLVTAVVAPARLEVKAAAAKPVSAAPAPAVPAPRFTTIDLRPWSDGNLKDSWLPNISDNDLASFPSGTHEVAGIPFEVGGVVQLSGNGQSPAASGFPEAVANIPIGKAFSKLHLLHACAGKDEAGVKVSAIVLHYADGQRRELPVNYGESVRDWWFWEFAPVSDPNTVMAWTGNNLNIRSQNGALRLYRTTWANPLPKTPVVSVDYVSGQSKAAPFMLGLTVE